jgi:hypothetical protein
MDDAKGKCVPGTRQKQQESEEGLRARRKAAKRALLERLAKQPAMNLGKWSRDEAYDED